MVRYTALFGSLYGCYNDIRYSLVSIWIVVWYTQLFNKFSYRESQLLRFYSYLDLLPYLSDWTKQDTIVTSDIKPSKKVDHGSVVLSPFLTGATLFFYKNLVYKNVRLRFLKNLRTSNEKFLCTFLWAI